MCDIDGKAFDATSSTMVFVSLEAGKTFGMEVFCSILSFFFNIITFS